VSATTQLSAARYRFSHAHLLLDSIFPSASAPPAASGFHGDDQGLIELSDADDNYADRHRGWSGSSRPEMTSWDWPLFLTPLSFDNSDWKLRLIDARRTSRLSLSLSLSVSL